jgi:hypothetical protein
MPGREPPREMAFASARIAKNENSHQVHGRGSLATGLNHRARQPP